LASNRLVVGPLVSQPDCRHLTTSAISASPIDGRKNGTFGAFAAGGTAGRVEGEAKF
jgi:hypothetical protein